MRRDEALAGAMLLAAVHGCAGGGPAVPPPRAVRTVVVEPASISRTTVVPCVLEGADEAVVTVPVAAMVTAVHVAEGDLVEEGDLLVSLETDAVHGAAVAAAAARVSAAGAALEYAESMRCRAETLHGSGAITPGEWEDAVATEAAASAALRLAEAGLGDARGAETSSSVRAPFPGLVTRVWARVGNPASGSLVALSGGGFLQATLLLAPAGLHDLRPGLPVFLTASRYPGDLFEGVITAVSPAVDPLSGLVPARAQFPNPDGRLFAGMAGTAGIALETDTAAIVVPQSAMLRTGSGGWTVAVVEDGAARFRDVETGIRSGFTWQVTSGLEPGDSLVLVGVTSLTEGDTVREAPR